MVYVDNSKSKYRNMIMSHMIADSIEELHEMADKIGVSRKYFQDKPSKPHYDICQIKRSIAIKYFGAIEITKQELVNKLKSK